MKSTALQRFNTADEWELVEHRLSIVTDVIARYDTYTTMD